MLKGLNAQKCIRILCNSAFVLGVPPKEQSEKAYESIRLQVVIASEFVNMSLTHNEKARAQYQFLRGYEDDWVTIDFIAAYMTNWLKRKTPRKKTR